MASFGLTKKALCLLLLAAGWAWADSPAAPAAAPETGRQLPQIDVQAQRQLERSLDSYLFKVTRGSVAVDDDPLLLWTTPICPLVTGLPHDLGQGLFDDFTRVLDSLSRPRGREGCKPNFIIIAMAHPQARLADWWHRHPAAFSYYEDGTEQFLQTSAPVRVWYNMANVDFDGAGAIDGDIVLDGIFRGVPSFKSHGNGVSQRTSFAVVPKLHNVIVVVDLEKIVGFAIAPLAEYIAMAGLTKVNLDATYAQTPTILRLFSAAESDRPGGLTGWDRSFIKAAYATDQFSRMQRVAVVRHMLADLSH